MTLGDVDVPAATMVDGFGRTADDVRLSVTDRCNFRCTYCMPAQGLDWIDRPELLTFDEMTRLVGVFLGLGARTVRLTGGEPLIRHRIEDLVAMLSAAGVPDLSLTTNGFFLAGKAAALAAAGLRRVNVSVDSLLRHRFAALTRRDALDQVMAGLQAAERAGLGPIKLNCVVLRGSNDDEVVDFATFARTTGYEVRFIEFMPLDADEGWSAEKVVPSEEVVDAIDRVYPLAAAQAGPEPARLFRFTDGAPGGIGVIPSVTAPFCSDCNRVRLTADGQFRTCLFSLDETDLKAMLRGGATDADIASSIRSAVAGKWAGHDIGSADFVRPARSMSMIGG